MDLFEVSIESSPHFKPTEKSFDSPSLRQRDESFLALGTPNDAQLSDDVLLPFDRPVQLTIVIFEMGALEKHVSGI